MTPRRLFLSRVDKSFRPDRDIAAGPWCFVENQQQFDGWENLLFTDAFAETSNLLQADAMTRRLANHLAYSWAERMNAKTCRNYSPAMWRNFLILWIVVSVQSN